MNPHQHFWISSQRSPSNIRLPRRGGGGEERGNRNYVEWFEIIREMRLGLKELTMGWSCMKRFGMVWTCLGNLVSNGLEYVWFVVWWIGVAWSGWAYKWFEIVWVFCWHVRCCVFMVGNTDLHLSNQLGRRLMLEDGNTLMIEKVLSWFVDIACYFDAWRLQQREPKGPKEPEGPKGPPFLRSCL